MSIGVLAIFRPVCEICSDFKKKIVFFSGLHCGAEKKLEVEKTCCGRNKMGKAV